MITAERQIGLVFNPLIVTSGIKVQGNVPSSQQYDVAGNVYEPDYTSENLVLVPEMEIADPDGILADGPVAIANLTWYVAVQGVETQIVSGNDYSVGSDGSLTVKRNSDPDHPSTYRWEGEYEDMRTGAVIRRTETLLVACESISAPPVLTLDCPKALRYDPIRETNPIRVITASLKVGQKEVPAANRKFIFQKKDTLNDWHDVGTDITDYDMEVSADGTKLTVDLSLIGDRTDIRCFALYNPHGSPNGMTVDSSTPMEEVAAVRCIGKLRGVVLSPRLFDPSQKTFNPELRVSDSKGEIPDPASKMDINWRTSKGVASGTVTKSGVLASGTAKPSIPTTNTDLRLGGKVFAEFEPKPAKACLMLDGAVLTLDGKTLIL